MQTELLPRSPLRPQDSREIASSLPHLQPGQAQLILTVGQRGKGKTDLIKRYISPDLLKAEEPRVLALDPFDDLRGLQLVETPEDAIDGLAQYDVCRRRLRPSIGDDSREYADDLFSMLVEDGVKDYLLVLDEVTLWTARNQGRALQTLVLQGRRLGVRMLVACQQLSLVPGVFLSECTTLVVFSTHRPRDLDVLEEWGGAELREIAARLPPHRAVEVRLS